MMNVVRTDLWIDAAFDQRLAGERAIALAILPVSDAAAGWKVLGAAHVYHVTAAKDELPREWFVTPALLGWPARSAWR